MACIKKIQQMKQIIEFTKNWKHRNLLHVVGGFLIGAFLSLLTTLGGVVAIGLVQILK